MLEELLAAEIVVIWGLDHALAQHLIGEVVLVRVLESDQPRHLSGRQRVLFVCNRVEQIRRTGVHMWGRRRKPIGLSRTIWAIAAALLAAVFLVSPRFAAVVRQRRPDRYSI